jgi:hypothetical protein
MQNAKEKCKSGLQDSIRNATLGGDFGKDIPYATPDF